MDLEQLRARLTRLDADLLSLVAERQALSRQVAEVKRAAGLPTRDYQREREVLLRAREAAGRFGLSPALAESLLRLLIHGSLATQERAQVIAHEQGSGKRALVIGGAGQMGRWFVDFLDSQGFAVEVADPSGAVAPHAHRPDWRSGDLTQDLIVVATPLGTTAGVLAELSERRPPGLVFDIGSMKSPLRDALARLAAAGVRVTSLHPMFGPDTDLLSGRHVIVVDVGRADAIDEARALFAPTMVEVVITDLDDHDRLMAYVLGLSHAVNIAFFTALAESGEAAPRLARLSSTTFDAQLAVASLVARESPALYYEIQALNRFGGESLQALADAVAQLRDLVARGDFTGFERLMQRGHAYLQDRAAARQS